MKNLTCVAIKSFKTSYQEQLVLERPSLKPSLGLQRISEGKSCSWLNADRSRYFSIPL